MKRLAYRLLGALILGFISAVAWMKLAPYSIPGVGYAVRGLVDLEIIRTQEMVQTSVLYLHTFAFFVFWAAVLLLQSKLRKAH